MWKKKARERQNGADAQQRSKCCSKAGLSRSLQPRTSLHGRFHKEHERAQEQKGKKAPLVSLHRYLYYFTNLEGRFAVSIAVFTITVPFLRNGNTNSFLNENKCIHFNRKKPLFNGS